MKYDDIPRKCTPVALNVRPSTIASAGTSTSVLLNAASSCSQSSASNCRNNVRIVDMS
jgi:hypothetical protein